MYISRLVLNMRNGRARRDVNAGYELHRTIISKGFGLTEGAPQRVLFRLEPAAEARRFGAG